MADDGVTPLAAGDQYAAAAALYDHIIGSVEQRSQLYRTFFANLLQEHGCRYILDASCGTGVDSAILLEHGFKVVSIDASAHMLEIAKKKKAKKAGDPRYDEWIIGQANWESLPTDLATFLPTIQFDAVVCLANSISHVLNDDGKQTVQRRCLSNLARCVKPGGLLLVDHRNYDALLDGQTPGRNIYYEYQNPVDIQSTLLTKDGNPKTVTIDFSLQDKSIRLSFYPHRVASFSRLVRAACAGAAHRVLGDFRPLGEVPVPGFYLHVVTC